MSLHLNFGDIHTSLAESVRGWAHANWDPGAAQRDEESRFDETLYRRLDTDLGIMNITLPEELGGSNLDVAATILVIEALSESDPGMAMSYLSQELLFAHQLYGTWHALNRPVPEEHAQILRNKWISGMAMTEPGAGTDVLGMTTRAVPCDGGFRLNGVKQWITNGPNGRVFLVYARTGEDRRAVSLFVVMGDTPGLTRSECDHKMGMRSSPTGILTFQDCFVPESALVGGLHEGLRPMIRNLAAERLGLAAQSCGIARTCFETMKTYAAGRRAFGKSIAEFGQIQRMIAESYALCRAMRATLCDAVWELLENQGRASESADAAKLFCSTAAETVGRNAIQVLGANGYSRAYPVERLYRDAVLLSIGGGTNEALQKNITRQLINA